MQGYLIFFFFFFNDTATTEIYTLSLHDALPIYDLLQAVILQCQIILTYCLLHMYVVSRCDFLELDGLTSDSSLLFWFPLASFLVTLTVEKSRSEEHTSELQSLRHLVCRLLLEKK